MRTSLRFTSVALTRHIGYNISDDVKFIRVFLPSLAVMVAMDLFAYVISV